MQEYFIEIVFKQIRRYLRILTLFMKSWSALTQRLFSFPSALRLKMPLCTFSSSPLVCIPMDVSLFVSNVDYQWNNSPFSKLKKNIWLPHIISKAHSVMIGKISNSLPFWESIIRSSSLAQSKLFLLKTSTKLLSIWKWNAGVSRRRQFSSVVRNMQFPSHGLRKEYSVALVFSFWLSRTGYLKN